MAKNVKYGKNEWKVRIINGIARLVRIAVFFGCILFGYLCYQKYRPEYKQIYEEQEKKTQEDSTQYKTAWTNATTEQGEVELTTIAKPEETILYQTVVESIEKGPTTLDQLIAVDTYGGGLVRHGSFSDSKGNSYSYGWGGGKADTDNGCEFSLNCAYQTFSGTVVLNGEYKTSPLNLYGGLSIYGDGKLLYMSFPSNLSEDEVDSFSVDVSDVNTLRLEIHGKNYVRLVNESLIQK